MLPAITFVVRLGKFNPQPRKSDFTDNMNAFELTPQEAEEWYRGRDVYPQAAPVADDVLVTFQHQPIGLAKRIGSRLKNSYPRELVRDGKLFTGNA